MILIFDMLNNASTYFCLGERFRKAFEFLDNLIPASLENGKYEIDGPSVFAIIQSATTKPKEAQVWEAHKKYADIQCLLSGEEWIGYAPLKTMEEALAYDAVRDFALYDGDGEYFQTKPGMFVIFFPHDVNKGCITQMRPARIRKIVVKVELP